ncbi:MAG: VOC family protein [Aestuariivita sp.]|nr:VOC family protein [Aestuariivita sp.]MCY4201815.1 VOC family protein [Aestuariivita sp.]MCY4289119.1 VOC family protein [Aestuariivita sp.]MCY4347719.1 VOC family protein [Aestuariivita sp.]
MANQVGTIVWNELNTHDIEGAKAFYGALLGWTYSVEGPHNYLVANKDGTPVAGFFDLSELENSESIPSSWLMYIETSDIESAVEKALASGGTSLRPPFTISGVGQIAIIMDGAGACFGLIQSQNQ